jgi:hypothetical protein
LSYNALTVQQTVAAAIVPAYGQAGRPSVAISLRKKTYKHKCPDSGTKVIYRNVDDAFPLYVKAPTVAGGLDAGPGAGSLGNVKAEYRSTVQAVLYNLDELNQTLMIEFRAIYLAYQTDPCGQASAFSRQVERIIDDVQQQTNWRMKARALIELASSDAADKEQIMGIFNELVGGLDGRAAAPVAREEVTAARADTDRWRSGAREQPAHGIPPRELES